MAGLQLAVQPRLAWNSQSSACPSLLSAGILKLWTTTPSSCHLPPTTLDHFLWKHCPQGTQGFLPVYPRPKSTASPISSTLLLLLPFPFMFEERKPLWGQGGALECQSLCSELIDCLLYGGWQRNQGRAVEISMGHIWRRLRTFQQA